MAQNTVSLAATRPLNRSSRLLCFETFKERGLKGKLGQRKNREWKREISKGSCSSVPLYVVVIFVVVVAVVVVVV